MATKFLALKRCPKEAVLFFPCVMVASPLSHICVACQMAFQRDAHPGFGEEKNTLLGLQFPESPLWLGDVVHSLTFPSSVSCCSTYSISISMRQEEFSASPGLHVSPAWLHRLEFSKPLWVVGWVFGPCGFVLRERCAVLLFSSLFVLPYPLWRVSRECHWIAGCLFEK